jgi:glutaminyl-peptide cyclotransferase
MHVPIRLRRLGLWIFAGGGCLLAACAPPAPSAPKSSTPWVIAFDGEAAWREAQRLVELGPRESGSPGAERAAHHLLQRLREAGVEAEIDAFEDDSPRGRIVFRNVEGRLPGRGEGLLVLGSHYDTKSGLGPDFQGANDSASSSGALIELGRILRQLDQEGRLRTEVRLVFFDGEECMVDYGPRDGLHGSRHYAEQLVRAGRRRDVKAVIILDMIGDEDLTITIPRNSTPSLIAQVFEAARAEGVRDKFSLHTHALGDDHLPFLDRGMPAIDLIDFEFGSAPGLNDYWHTAEDRLERISAQSLEIVGRVTLRVIEKLQ